MNKSVRKTKTYQYQYLLKKITNNKIGLGSRTY